jgi:hypothetical protein
MKGYYSTGLPYNIMTILEPQKPDIVVCVDCNQSIPQCTTLKHCGRCPTCSYISISHCVKCKGCVCLTCVCKFCNVYMCNCHSQCQPKELRQSSCIMDLDHLPKEVNGQSELIDLMSDMDISSDNK